MDTKEEILARMKNSNKKDLVVKNENKKFKLNLNMKNTITKVLISVIFVFASLIYVKFSDENETLYKEYILTNSMSFMTINEIYENYFGDITPSINNEEFVFSDELVYTAIETVDDKEIITLTSSVITSLCGGIVVYIGEKDDYGYTVIVQGNDSNNIWYGNLDNVSLSLYDYIEEGEIIGEAIDKTLYLTIKNGNEIISYENYQN